MVSFSDSTHCLGGRKFVAIVDKKRSKRSVSKNNFSKCTVMLTGLVIHQSSR